MSKTIYIGGRLESKEKGNVVTGANAILDDTKGKKQNVINKETDDELARLEQSKQDNLNFDSTPTEDSTNPVTSGGVYTAEKALSDAIEAILLLIPSAATALNKLVDTNTMNSSISTATATFRGTYNAVSDLGLTYQATHAQIEAALDALGLTADNNDFAFVQIPVSDQSQDIAKTERFKFNGTNWLYEYDLNTSGFTAAQWAAINSTITLALVQKLAALPTNAELLQALGLKQDVLTFDNAPTTDSNNPVKSGGIKNAIDTAVGDESTARENADTALSGLIGDEKTRAEGVEGGLDTRLGAVEGSVSTIQGVIPSEATSSNKLVDNSSMTTYIGTIIDNIDATFNMTSTDGHVTLAITQVNGVITSVQLITSDIASAAALNLKASQADLTALAGRVTTAEGNITSLTGRMTTAESDIDTLTNLYNALQQSAPQVIQPTDTWPVANPSATVIYRVIDRVNTPPEYYSDYMWNGTSMVLMATYNNAVDTTPKKDSANLITSGGVFANIGAFDISEYHKSGSTLATYADLTAALAALPSDFQKGGMSIKFVQTSDNKYVQYRLIADTWSIDTNEWCLYSEDVLVENPEWIKVIIDSEMRILAGIKADGSIYLNSFDEKTQKSIDKEIKTAIDSQVQDFVCLYAYADGDSTPDDDTHFYGWKNGKCAWQRAIDAADGVHRTLIFCKGKIKVTTKPQFTLQPNGFYNVLYIPHDKSNIELIGEGVDKSILEVTMPDDFDDIGHYQPMDILGDNCIVQNLAVYSKNARYCIHLDPSVSRQADYHTITLRDVLLKRYAGEIQEFLTPLGLGIGDGMHLILERCTLIAETPGVPPLYIHDNEDFDSNFIFTIKDCTLINESSSLSDVIYIDSLGSKNTGDIVFENNDISVCKPIFNCRPKNRNLKTSLSDFVPKQFFNIKGHLNAPIGYVTSDSNAPTVLRITSKATGGSSKVRFNINSSAYNVIIRGLYPTDYTDIFGVVHTDGYQYRDGSVGLSGYAMGELSIDSGKQSSLQSRLGDCRNTPLSLVVEVNGTDYTIIFNQDYTNYSDADMLSVFTSVLGSVADVELYNWSADYFPELQPSLIIRKNTSNEAILCGMGVHFIGNTMVKATDDSEVDGVAIDDIVPGVFGRIVRKAMLAVSQSDHHHICFDVVPSSSSDLQNYGIGETAGVFTEKANGILKYEGYKGFLTINL